MARACHAAIPAKYEREGLVAKDFAYPECFEYPLRHGDHDPKSGKRLSKEIQLELTKGRVRNAASRLAQFEKNLPGSDRGRVKAAIDRAKALHGIGDRSTTTPNRANTGEHMTTNPNAEMLRTLANRPGVSAEAKKKLLDQAKVAESKATTKPAKPAKKAAAKKASKPAAAKPAKKKASKPKAAKKAAAKKAAPAKTAAAKPAAKPAAKKAAKKAKPKSTKAAAKPAAKKAAKKAPKKKETAAQAKKKRAAGSKRAAAKKASTHKKAPMATETKTEEKAEAAKATTTPKKKGNGKAKAKTAKAKSKAKSKGAKKPTAKKSKPKAKKAKAASKAKKAATPKKTSPKKKAGKKAPKKATAKKAAPKAKAKAKSKAKKKAAKKAAPAAMAAAPAPTPKKTSPKKKAGKKAPKKAKAKTGAVKKSTSLSYAGAKVPPAVKKATKAAKKVSQTTKYRDKSGNTSIVHRMFNPATETPKKSHPIVNLLILTGGGVVGWTVNDVVDRFVATRAGDAKYPWYSTDAAERIMLRPDGMRLAAQGFVTVAFFAASAFASEKMPRFAYFLGGAAVGSAIHWAGQLITTAAMPRLLSAEKGNERTLANRLYPMEQLAVQTPAMEAVDAENKNWKTAIGQQDGKTPAELPDAYLWPTAGASQQPATQTSSTAQTTGRVAGVAGVDTTRLPAGRPTIQYPARPAAQPVQATPRAGAFVGEPVARAAVRTAPLSQQKPGVVGCGGQGCGKCSACKRPDADVDNGYQDGLNVAVTSPRPVTELPHAMMPQQPVEVIPSGADTSVPQVDTTQPRGMSKVGDAMVRAVGSPGDGWGLPAAGKKRTACKSFKSDGENIYGLAKRLGVSPQAVMNWTVMLGGNDTGITVEAAMLASSDMPTSQSMPASDIKQGVVNIMTQNGFVTYGSAAEWAEMLSVCPPGAVSSRLPSVRSNGRPTGRVRPRLDAGLLGSTNTSRQAHMGGRGAGRMN